MLIKILRAALPIGLATVVTAALLAPPALAEPAVPPQTGPSSTARGTAPAPDDRKLSAKAKADIRATWYIATRAIGRTKSKLNYEKATRYDQGRTSARRKFAAGWIFGGKPVYKISRAELQRVNVYVKQFRQRYNHLRSSRMSIPVEARAVYCKGMTRWVTLRQPPLWAYDHYFNSCDTAKIITTMNVIGGVAGILALVTAGGGYTAAYTVWAGVVGAVAVIAGQVVDLMAKMSDLESVVLRNNFHIVTVRPQ